MSKQRDDRGDAFLIGRGTVRDARMGGLLVSALSGDKFRLAAIGERQQVKKRAPIGDRF